MSEPAELWASEEWSEPVLRPVAVRAVPRAPSRRARIRRRRAVAVLALMALIGTILLLLTAGSGGHSSHAQSNPLARFAPTPQVPPAAGP